jgi:bifunctional enzyme CysN/CysC
MAPDAGRDMLRVLACGSVDDGKSTLIGRLLHDCGAVPEDVLAALAADSRRHGTVPDGPDLALLLDGLEAEREQGITIDVAHRFLATPRRAFRIADAPGHAQYTRNMATGASNSDVALILVDARKGVLTQTRRHSHICALLGIRHAVLVVNKMDLVGHDEAVFARIAADYAAFAAPLGFAQVVALPVVALSGGNVVHRCDAMPWHAGPTLLEHLERIAVTEDAARRPFRMAVQWVNRAGPDFRGLSGTVASGRVAVGQAVMVAASGRRSAVAGILAPQGEVTEAAAGQAVTLRLAEDVDAARGDLLAAPDMPPTHADQFAAHVIWFDEEPMLTGRQYWLRCGTCWTTATVGAIRHAIDADTLAKQPARSLAMNGIGLVHLATATPIAFDTYEEDRATGAFILVDRLSERTVAAGMILHPLRRAANLKREAMLVDGAARAALKAQRPMAIWLTGLSGAGKSTIAKLLEQRLHAAGRHTYVLDGDNLRLGLNRDLGFTDADRAENVRRAGEVARLMVDAGLIVICALISPFRAERQAVREFFAPGAFIEVFVDAPIEECARRDPKGLYARARRGEIPNLTGIASAYEVPEAPEIRLETARLTPAEAVEAVLRRIGET